jgi:phenylpropionate dioxygenase-like ring-hydroxylating dioxygenase large terminal subunit
MTDYASLIENDRVHGSLYVEPAVFAAEMEAIFYRGWVFVGHESEVIEPGQWVTRRVGRENVILVRDLEGKVNVLANRCSHRGNALCWQERGRSRSFQCTYHGWTFGLDGSLRGIPYPGGIGRGREALGLDRPGQVESWRGFVFADISGKAGPLAGHLGPGGRELIDRLCDLSPTGSIRLDAGWIGHRIESNWKMWPESDNDGYHLDFVHASMLKAAPDSYYQDTVVGGEAHNASRAVDRGKGHFELDMRPSYKGELVWLGTTREKVPDYALAVEARLGAVRGRQALRDGPPHAFIFPNLFLGELNIARIEPVSLGLTVHHHTAVQLEGVDETFNRRLLRQSEAALGPASFIVPDDAVTAERMQAALSAARNDGLIGGTSDRRAWIDISRGTRRETVDADGLRSSHVSDEVTNRAFWRHYRTIMSRATGGMS